MARLHGRTLLLAGKQSRFNSLSTNLWPYFDYEFIHSKQSAKTLLSAQQNQYLNEQRPALVVLRFSKNGAETQDVYYSPLCCTRPLLPSRFRTGGKAPFDKLWWYKSPEVEARSVYFCIQVITHHEMSLSDCGKSSNLSRFWSLCSRKNEC